jgi:hypothetical protein
MYPIFNRQVPSHDSKYQQLFSQKHVPISSPKAQKYYTPTPFLSSNKIPGAWQPMSFHKTHYITKGQVLNDFPG